MTQQEADALKAKIVALGESLAPAIRKYDHRLQDQFDAVKVDLDAAIDGAVA